MRERVEEGGQQRKGEEGRGKLEEQLGDMDNVWGTKKSLGREHVRGQRDGRGENGHLKGPSPPLNKPQVCLARRSGLRVSRFRKGNYRSPR